MDGESSRQKRRNKIMLPQDQVSESQSLPLEYLREITNNFSDEHLLGKGGFGNVYKGVDKSGALIAVKKLTLTMPGVQDRQFENEICHLMKLKHPNIVQIVGYCSETESTLVQYDGKYVLAEKSERLICLEYLPKGSLHNYLSDESSGLDWYRRYNIIEGICYGLHYLHEEWKVNTPIIHMDLKPPNILLDDNLVPKIADFGLSRLFGEEQTRTCTASCEGTLGYMAPEYIDRGIITKKLDIFSLGVLIIEIMTGQKEYPYETEVSFQKFIELVLKNWRNRLEKSSSSDASRDIDCQQIRRCIQIGLMCIKLNWEERPTTGQIIKMLHGSTCAEYSNKREALRWGPRTLEEAVTLAADVTSHGEGRQNTIAGETGRDNTWLMNQYQRPDLQGWNFTTDEQRLIVELHSRWGNRWSSIAAQLPGRTDDEIKNYWKTRVKNQTIKLNCRHQHAVKEPYRRKDY
ncbi:hypothetical protein ACP70R_032285 [Stipagrostis hirtigluma subsp. patula]